MKKSIEELIYEETEVRLKEMEAEGYKFPKKIDKFDVICIVLSIAISILLTVLCMTEVIV